MGTASHILALDQGTTSSRAMVFDSSARVVSVAQQPITQIYPQPGWVNQDAAEIWTTTLETARAALRQAGLAGPDIAGIGIVNQRETLVVWDRATSRAGLRRRSSGRVARVSRRSMRLLRAAWGRRTKARPVWFPDAYFTASKLAWLLEDDPELRRRAEAGELLAGTVDSWLLWNLTGGAVHATDVSNASRTMLFDIRALDWSPELVQDLAIPRPMLPQVVSSAGVAGFDRARILRRRTFPSQGSPVISKPPSLARPASLPGRPRTPMGRAHSCS